MTSRGARVRRPAAGLPTSRAAGAVVPRARGDPVGPKHRAPDRSTRGWHDGACWAAWSVRGPHTTGKPQPAEATHEGPGRPRGGSPVETGPPAPNAPTH